MAKYVNPLGGTVRLASLSGHVILVGEEPVEIPSHMESEARSKGCRSEEEYEMLKQRIIEQSGGSNPQDDGQGSKTKGSSGDEDSEKLEKVKAVMRQMVEAEKDEYFTAQDKPRANVVDELAGFEVAKEMREAAWESVLTEMDK